MNEATLTWLFFRDYYVTFMHHSVFPDHDYLWIHNQDLSAAFWPLRNIPPLGRKTQANGWQRDFSSLYKVFVQQLFNLELVGDDSGCCTSTTLKSCDFSYLKADLIVGLFGIAFDGVGRSHSRGVDGTIVGNDESVASIVQFQPI